MSASGHQQRRLQPGTVLNEVYEITGVFGSGGFATVYKGKQLNLGGRPVAIKVLNTYAEGKGAEVVTQRFMREAMAAAHIQHPNVVMIHDVGFLDGVQPFIVMQPFEGHDLGVELDNNGPLDPTRALPLFIGCLGALAKAHELGIIHRDLKPDNLVLTDPGTREESLKLIDFGIARLTSEQVQLTNTGQIFGTPRYMAPEYITTNHISPALDVYQMGLIIAETLTGEPAIRGENHMHCLHLISTGRLHLDEGLMASPIGEIIRGAVTMDPALRYPDAAVLRNALEKLDPASIPNLASARKLSRSQAYESLPTIETPSGNMALRTGVLLESQLSPLKERVAVGARGGAIAAPLHPAAGPAWDKANTFSATPEPPNIPEPAQSAKPRLGLILGIAFAAALCILLIAGIGVTAWIGLDNDERTPDPPAQALVSKQDKTATATTPQPKATPAEESPAEEPPVADAEAAAPSEVEDAREEDKAPEVTPSSVKIVVVPARAQARISEGSDVLGRGNADVSFDSGEAPERSLLIVAKGYQSQRVNVGPSDGPRMTVQLRALQKPSKASKASDKPPPAADKKGGGGFKILQ